MPMHDWTRVSAGTFHDFHNAWITHIKESLNAGLLPNPYYALGEQRAGEFGPDVLTLKAEGTDEAVFSFSTESDGMVAVALSPPKVQASQEAVEDMAFYLQRQRAVVIRHASGEYHAVEGLPLTLVSYTASHPIKAWIEPFAVGTTLTAMPLFLTNGHYIPLPLEETYSQSWAGVPERWRRVVLDGT